MPRTCVWAAGGFRLFFASSVDPGFGLFPVCICMAFVFQVRGRQLHRGVPAVCPACHEELQYPGEGFRFSSPALRDRGDQGEHFPNKHYYLLIFRPQPVDPSSPALELCHATVEPGSERHAAGAKQRAIKVPSSVLLQPPPTLRSGSVRPLPFVYRCVVSETADRRNIRSHVRPAGQARG